MTKDIDRRVEGVYLTEAKQNSDDRMEDLPASESYPDSRLQVQLEDSLRWQALLLGLYSPQYHLRRPDSVVRLKLDF